MIVQSYQLKEVFIPVGIPMATRITRDDLETSLKSWERSRAKHLLIFGPSKSGKTTLWKGYIEDQKRKGKPQPEIIKYSCNEQSTLEGIYRHILCELKVYYLSDTTQTKGKSNQFQAEFKTLIASLRGTRGENETTAQKTTSFNPNIDANTVIKFLKITKKIIILEEFHYVDDNLKRLLSQDLKAFADENCPWIIIGVKPSSFELINYNQDLEQRVSEVSVKWFNDTQIKDMIEYGEDALHIRFSEKLKQDIINKSLGCAYIAQEICLQICLLENIETTQNRRIILEDTSLLSRACEEIIRLNNPDIYRIFLSDVCSCKINFPSQEFRWIFKLIKEKGIPDKGLSLTKLCQELKELGESKIFQPKDWSTGLTALTKFLIENREGMRIDFRNDTFFLLDKYMQFVFKWCPEIVDEIFQINL